MLIIEGGDLVGKTTFIKEHLLPLLAPQGYIYSHFSRLPKNFDYAHGYIERASKYIVQDRFHMSELVYAKIRGEEPAIVCHNRYHWIDCKLRLIPAFMVVITAAQSLIEKRYEARKEQEMYDLKRTCAANAEFFEIVHAKGCHQTIGGKFFDTLWDWHIHCAPTTREFPTRADAIQLLKQYNARLDAWTSIETRGRLR